MTFDEKTSTLIRLAYVSQDPELQRRVVDLIKKRDRLPMDPHTVMQDARDEGVLALEETEAPLPQQPHRVVQDAMEEGVLAGEDEDDIPALTIFDDPSEAESRLARMARTASSPQLRDALLRVIDAGRR